MKFFTLDRLGYVKTIEFNKKTAKPAPSKKLLKKLKKPEGGEPVETVERLCIEGIQETLSKIFLKSPDELLIVTASNQIFTFNVKENKSICHSDLQENPSADSLMASYSHNILITCTPNGLMTYFDLNEGQEEMKTIQVSLGQDKLVALAIHPQFPHIFATVRFMISIWKFILYREERKGNFVSGILPK